MPTCRHLWLLVLLIAFGGLVELYEVSLTAYISPGLFRSGIFHSGPEGLFGMTDQAAFASATFAGLFVGTIGFGALADRLGRRGMFAITPLWYGSTTIVIALQNSALGVDLWRFVAAIGLGIEIVTIDACISEMVPKQMRGRAYAVMIGTCQLGVTLAALLGWLLIPTDPFGMAGWRWMLLVGSLASIAVWVVRWRYLPESPRWLILRGRLADAERVTDGLERHASADIGGPLPEPQIVAATTEAGHSSSFGELWRPPYRSRTIMLSIFEFLQTIGFYGFGNWIPALVAAQGISITRSLFYSVLITIVAPIAPLFWMIIADRMERKWQIVGAAAGTAVLGLLFALQANPVFIVVLGIQIIFSNSLLGYSHHAYCAELFPTRVRARAVGFVYSWSRLSTAFSSLMIGFFLQHFGSPGVFVFIALAMLGVILSIGIFGPRTKGLSLEEISR